MEDWGRRQQPTLPQRRSIKLRRFDFFAMVEAGSLRLYSQATVIAGFDNLIWPHCDHLNWPHPFG